MYNCISRYYNLNENHKRGLMKIIIQEVFENIFSGVFNIYKEGELEKQNKDTFKRNYALPERLNSSNEDKVKLKGDYMLIKADIGKTWKSKQKEAVI